MKKKKKNECIAKNLHAVKFALLKINITAHFERHRKKISLRGS